MKTCQVVTVQTPKKYLLDGLWFGPDNAETAIVWIHGLSGSAFSHVGLIELLADKKTAVLGFSNRGSGLVNGIKRLDPRNPRGYQRDIMGKAHEVFTDCVDDIEGAVRLAAERGAQRIFLAGHSTGCQKSAYYLAHKPHTAVKGAILLAPMSDYADIIKDMPAKQYQRLVAAARKLVAAGKPHELMPAKLWPHATDAQRFLSLFTPESKEEIFTYATGKKPATLNKVKQPLLALLPELDEHCDRPMTEVAAWFEQALAKQAKRIEIVTGVPHSFEGKYPEVAKLIRTWIKGIK